MMVAAWLMAAAIGTTPALPPFNNGCGAACVPHQSVRDLPSAVQPTTTWQDVLIRLTQVPVGAYGRAYIPLQRAADVIWDHAPHHPDAAVAWFFWLLNAPVGGRGRALIPAQRAADALWYGWPRWINQPLQVTLPAVP